MEVKLPKAMQRHQILMLAMHKQISQRKVAEGLGPSLCHIKLLVSKPKEAEGDIHGLLYQRRHPA